MTLLHTQVAIIGAGLVGASAALALRRAGVATALIERGLCGARASGINFGGVRRQGRSIEQLHLAQRAHGVWARLPELIGTDAEYRRTGHLKLARSQSDLDKLVAYRERVRDFDLDLHILDRAALPIYALRQTFSQPAVVLFCVQRLSATCRFLLETSTPV